MPPPPHSTFCDGTITTLGGRCSGGGPAAASSENGMPAATRARQLRMPAWKAGGELASTCTAKKSYGVQIADTRRVNWRRLLCTKMRLARRTNGILLGGPGCSAVCTMRSTLL